MFDVSYYTLPNGRKPVKDFIDSLTPKMQVKAMASIEILEEFGNQLREPYSKPMGDGIFELRIQFASDISHIFYFFFVGNRIILTNGFIKKRARPRREKLRLPERTRRTMKGEPCMSEFREHLEELKKNPQFAAEYERTRSEREVMRAVIRARLECKLTQKELARRTGIRQSNISRIENGTSSPTVDTLARLAEGMGKRLTIEFR